MILSNDDPGRMEPDVDLKLDKAEKNSTLSFPSFRNLYYQKWLLFDTGVCFYYTNYSFLWSGFSGGVSEKTVLERILQFSGDGDLLGVEQVKSLRDLE